MARNDGASRERLAEGGVAAGVVSARRVSWADASGAIDDVDGAAGGGPARGRRPERLYNGARVGMDGQGRAADPLRAYAIESGQAMQST